MEIYPAASWVTICLYLVYFVCVFFSLIMHVATKVKHINLLSIQFV